jgi:hypothetical protein
VKLIKLLAIVVSVYVVVVVAFESFVAYMGSKDAEAGVASGGSWMVITTSDGHRSYDTMVAGVEIDGALYVAANHWPRGWYRRAVESGRVEVAQAGERSSRRVERVTGAERMRVARVCTLPWFVRFLSGYPPRAFLRLTPR